MTKRELMRALLDDEGSMDETVRLTGNIFETEEIDTEDLTICFVNSNEEDETTLVVG